MARLRTGVLIGRAVCGLDFNFFIIDFNDIEAQQIQVP